MLLVQIESFTDENLHELTKKVNTFISEGIIRGGMLSGCVSVDTMTVNKRVKEIEKSGFAAVVTYTKQLAEKVSVK